MSRPRNQVVVHVAARQDHQAAGLATARDGGSPCMATGRPRRSGESDSRAAVVSTNGKSYEVVDEAPRVSSPRAVGVVSYRGTACPAGNEKCVSVAVWG